MNYLKRIAVCAPLTVLVVVVSMLPAVQFSGWQWCVALLSVPVVTWGAWPFHRAAVVTARHGGTTMDTLVSLGVTASTVWSWWVLLTMRGEAAGGDLALHGAGGGGHLQIYFEGAAVITLFLLIGRYIEQRTKGVARDALSSLMAMAAPVATLVYVDETGQRSERIINSDELQVGDLVVVRPGEKLPADGVVIEGESAIDASLVSGESLPVDVGVESQVTGGTINTWGVLLVRVTACGDEATMARIGRMVLDAQAGKATMQRLADRISSVFVPAVIALSLVTTIGWLWFSGDAQLAMRAGVAVLIVACPCALGLATPTALMVGSARAARSGIIVRSIAALETSGRLSAVVFDKTGTVTDGQMKVVAHHISTGQGTLREWGEAAQWSAAASVEQMSEHPIGRAIVDAAVELNCQPYGVEAFMAHAGNGVSALVGDDLVLLARPSWCAELGIPVDPEVRAVAEVEEAHGATVVLLARIAGVKKYLTSGDSLHIQSESVQDDCTLSLEAGGVRDDVEIAISGMTCASCVGRVERKLRKMGGVSAQVNLATERAVVRLDRDLQPEDLLATVRAAGYEAQFIGFKKRQAPVAVRLSDPSAWDGKIRELLATVGGLATAVFAVRDAVKPDARESIAELHAQGLRVALLTGDQPRAAESVAQMTGISTVFSQVSPVEKVRTIGEFQASGEVVAMVGDGVNDAAALAQAHLGIAMSSGTDVAQDVADIIVTTSRLASVTEALGIAQATLRVIRQNLGWAFGYNSVLIPLAVAGMLNPMWAAAAMSLSSVCVVVNSLRLRYYKFEPRSR